ncbi:MAG: FecR domain-containing protein [Deltaproteobacteria bacterium]|nr:FecR domain-containing protein [Deltaproteobacteria bacterium]MBW2445270.1 FecR domain-containing protein [Deltaproteobacteria bacterium]
MRPLLLALVLLPWLAASAPAEADDPAQSGANAIGKVLATEGKVSATLGSDTRTVERGEAVYKGDWLETDRSSRAKVLLNDDTELVVGPASRLHLDEFVYNDNSNKGKVLIEMGVGLLRFTSGKLEPESYEVQTPVASIGVRGTIFDTLVAAVTYVTTVILREGNVVIKTFGGSQTVKKKDHASSAESSTDKPEPQRKVTDEEDDLSDPLKKPFKDELPRTTKRPRIPDAVKRPPVNPSHSRPGPSNRPSNRY